MIIFECRVLLSFCQSSTCSDFFYSLVDRYSNVGFLQVFPAYPARGMNAIARLPSSLRRIPVNNEIVYKPTLTHCKSHLIRPPRPVLALFCVLRILFYRIPSEIGLKSLIRRFLDFPYNLPALYQFRGYTAIIRRARPLPRR